MASEVTYDLRFQLRDLNNQWTYVFLASKCLLPFVGWRKKKERREPTIHKPAPAVKNFKVEFCISLNPEMKFLRKSKLEISYYAKNVLANIYFIIINPYNVLSNMQKENFK